MQVSSAAEAGLTPQEPGAAQSATDSIVSGSLDQAPEAGLSRDAAMLSSNGGVTELTPGLASLTLDDARLAMDAYSDSGAPEGFTRLDDAQLSETVGAPVVTDDPETGFGAGVYRSDETGDMTVAFRGSQSDSLQDIRTDWLGTNFGQAFGNEVPESYQQGSELAGLIQGAYGDEADVSLTGHSMGGGIANYAAIENDMDYTAFNAAGLSSHTVDQLGDDVDNYSGRGVVINDAYDPLTNLGGNNNAETWGDGARHVAFDELVFVENDNFSSWWDTAFDFGKRVDAHNLGNVLPVLEETAAMA